MASISKLPAPSSPPPTLSTGTVTLYKDNNWSGSSLSFNINDYAKDTRQSISGTSMQDGATWLAFNLPVGTVVTMMDNWVTPPNGNVYDLKNCGRVVDLVGTGQTEAVDLTKCNMNDDISAWFWHTPDMNIGGVELYENANFQGNRTVLFLSEWTTGQPIALTDWYIADRASSVCWTSLHDAQMVSLFQNADGSGSSYANIKGWGSFKELSDLKSVGFNDTVSSFSWNNLKPMQQVIAPAPIPPPNPTDLAYVQRQDATNNLDVEQKQTITLDKSKEQTTSVTVTNQYTAGMQMSYSTGYQTKGSEKEKTVTWMVQLSFTYSYTESTTMTETQTASIGISQEFTVPPNSKCVAILTVQMGNLPNLTAYSTTAERWYDQQLDDSTLDPDNGWYKRTEIVTFDMNGCVAVATTLVTEPVE